MATNAFETPPFWVSGSKDVDTWHRKYGPSRGPDILPSHMDWARQILRSLPPQKRTELESLRKGRDLLAYINRNADELLPLCEGNIASKREMVSRETVPK